MSNSSAELSTSRGADLLAGAMQSAGVSTVFSLSGNQIMPLYDAFLDVDIRVVHTRHEAAAVFMAEAYAQLNATIGVALVTAAPGFGNALGAIYSAHMSETPVVFLSGDSSVTQDGMGAFQEFDQGQAIAPFVKHTQRVLEPQAFPQAFKTAMEIALSGRCGPVHLSLPFDVLNKTVDTASNPCDIVAQPVRKDVGNDDIAAFLKAIDQAERPLVLTGSAMTRTRVATLGQQLADTLHAPVIAMESPRGLNDPALGGLSHVLADADLIVYLGKRPDFMTGFGRALASKTCIAIDEDPSVHDRIAQIHDKSSCVRFVAEPRLFAQSCVNNGSDGARAVVPERAAWRKKVATAIASRVTATVSAGIAPDVLASQVNDWLAQQADAVLIIDGGEFGQWSQAYATSERRIINGPSGAIGASIPYAIAAKVSQPSATVVALLGDGTAGFHLSEFETAARAGTNIIAVIGNDARWNAEHLIQVRDFGQDRAFACELSEGAAYEQVAHALGGFGQHVSDVGQITPALDAALASGKPACINVVIEGVAAPVVTAADVAT